MGSIIFNIACPQCGRVAVEDFYYKRMRGIFIVNAAAIIFRKEKSTTERMVHVI